jgi:hypothetical protein
MTSHLMFFYLFVLAIPAFFCVTSRWNFQKTSVVLVLVGIQDK